MEKEPRGLIRRLRTAGKTAQRIIVLFAVVILLFAALYINRQVKENRDHAAEVITISSLEKLVDVSDLSTFTAVYNGVAKVNNQEQPDRVDYYVSYEARVNAGIDFESIQFAVDHEQKQVSVTLPPVQIIDTTVDISSLDFIFYNKMANTLSVSQEAYKVCMADVQTESAKQTAIKTLAQENAENAIKAMITPLIQQYDPDYQISVQQEGSEA